MKQSYFTVLCVGGNYEWRVVDKVVCDLYPNAIGGVTWVGAFPVEGVDDINSYIGFDTMHPFTRKMTLKDVVNSLHAMVNIDQAEINGGTKR